MQKIDRLKVMHAKDAFYNPETGRFLPSLDTAQASSTRDAIAMSSGLIPQQVLEEKSQILDFPSMISENDVVTKHEIKDICERFGTKPSER